MITPIPPAIFEMYNNNTNQYGKLDNIALKPAGEITKEEKEELRDYIEFRKELKIKQKKEEIEYNKRMKIVGYIFSAIGVLITIFIFIQVIKNI